MNPLLSVENVGRSFGGLRVLKGVTFTVPRGGIHALIGPNGSGKSTLFHILTGFLEPDTGVIRHHGDDMTREPSWLRARRGIARSFQDLRVFPFLTVADHVRLALHGEDESPWTALRRGPKAAEGAAPSERVREALERVGLACDPATPGKDLSYGQTKLLGLAMALSAPHDLLLLDEPVAGVNPALRASLRDLLASLRADGETILLIEHDMNFVMELADRVLALDAGELVADGAPREVRENPRVLEAYLGPDHA